MTIGEEEGNQFIVISESKQATVVVAVVIGLLAVSAQLHSLHLQGSFLISVGEEFNYSCAEGKRMREGETFSTMGQWTTPSRQLGAASREINYLQLNDTLVATQ